MSREEKYRRLMTMYPGLTPEDIADMTPYQQVSLADRQEDQQVTFSSEAEYAAWTIQRLRSGAS